MTHSLGYWLVNCVGSISSSSCCALCFDYPLVSRLSPFVCPLYVSQGMAEDPLVSTPPPAPPAHTCIPSFLIKHLHTAGLKPWSDQFAHHSAW